MEPRDINFIARIRPAIGLLVLLILPFGCASVHPEDRYPGELPPDSGTRSLRGRDPAGLALGITRSRGSTLVAVRADEPVSILDRASAAAFRPRALAQQQIIRAGAKFLPFLAVAHADAPLGSHRARTFAFLIEQVQERQTAGELGHELAKQTGVRQLAAVRVAGAHGAVLVPALIALVVHGDRDTRREAILALRSITDRHPASSGRHAAQAIRVWRTWYDGAPPNRR